MKETWATSGIDLLLDVTGPRARASLERGLRDAIGDRRLAAATRLPSSRSLATELHLARNTVAEAYAQLVAEGWLESRPGSGTWVADRPPHPVAARVPKSITPVPCGYDLRPGAPDLSSFPRRAWLQATRRVLVGANDDAFGYADPRGLLELRTALAGYLSRVRHVVASPDNIVICAGISHGLSLICEVIRRRGGQSLAVEAYGYDQLWDIAAATGIRLVPMPVDDHGAVIEHCAGTDGALITPGHQIPWGVSLHPSRRRQIVEWTTATSSMVIEDDYDGEFRYDRQPVGALQALAPDRIVYAGTASKSLGPGLRLGWLVVPDSVLDEVIETKRTRGATCSSIDQLVLADLILSGAYDRLVRRARLHYRRRREQLVAALHERVPGVIVQGAAAGLQTVVLLPHGRTEADIVSRGRDAGVTLLGLTTYSFPGHHGPPALIVGFARPPEQAYPQALKALCTALSSPSPR